MKRNSNELDDNVVASPDENSANSAEKDAAPSVLASVETSGDQMNESTKPTEPNPEGENEAGTPMHSRDESNPPIETSNGDTTADPAPANSAATSVDITRPVKRARTAYFIFAHEHRAALQAKVRHIFVALRARVVEELSS
jgi:hypothetical protein